MKNYFFAVDLGATSGRTIIGNIADGRLVQEEVTRFPNNLIEQGGHFYWDIFALYHEIIRGLKEVAKRGVNISSIGIDTWGVDFVFIGDDGDILRNPRAYRDPVTFDAMDDYLKHVICREEVYEVAGIQFMNFNSIFQLYAMKREGNTAFKHADKILFMPEVCYSGGFADAASGCKAKKRIAVLTATCSAAEAHQYQSSDDPITDWLTDCNRGAFTSALSRGLGGKPIIESGKANRLAADKNGDKRVTIKELYSFINSDSVVKETNQQPQFYAPKSMKSLVLYKK